ncbi:hypothetical protein [Actinophytocola algeriensis]|uniref:Uncharacterized protein n=1 Tax=Actinophytocola algeriensis TaxID=1768010 RepID=A0A7W7VHQ7_9PSEU|nr:hypothetical protein [Actinophytocola algeriensis]MBB4910767.1 hypothetical protein [Actinophytocola algeriensis]MBE1473760.1 hypothetical protein [Actinophytocola algeriensis]
MRAYLENQLGTERWVTLYQFDDYGASDTDVTMYCALADCDRLDDVLAEDDWDLLVGDGGPGFEGHGEAYHYVRTHDRPVEPFVHVRDFGTLGGKYNELSEEFRLFHDLCEDKKRGRLVLFDEAADEIEVAVVRPEVVKVKLSYLKEYLSARDMCLVVYFEYNRHSPTAPVDLGFTGDERWHSISEDLRYEYFVRAWDGISLYKSAKSLGRLRGKKIVRGNPIVTRGPWARNRKTYESFIIGVDDTGNDVTFTCDSAQLANGYGKNPAAPPELMPVFFQKEVLGKYYSDARRYKVADSHVWCSGAWSLKVDNNHPDFVIVYLGDLGDLPSREQLYWKSFNISPEGAISRTYYDRTILGLWVEPEEPALLFKSRYQRFRADWFEKFEWDLFKPLSSADAYTFDTLHVPSDGNEGGFDTQTLALAKVLIERINEAEIATRIALEKNDKGISKFEKYLAVAGFHETGTRLDLLRNLQSLRSGPAHVKGDQYLRATRYFNVDEKGFAVAFADILSAAIEFINRLAAYFDLGWEDQEDANDLLEKLT